ncbi:MAG: YheC/YheD family protein [Parcubacteria group bacterium]|jgi:glutathione synthase/RimK-type ligase-like ATP-grasp enzyme
MKEAKKIIVVYYGSDWKRKVPLGDAVSTRVSFEDWHERGLECGVGLYRASIGWYDAKKNVFTKSWAYRNKRWLKITKPVKPDLIFDKIMGKRDYALYDYKMETSKKVKWFNSPLFRTIADNKLNQYLLFKEFMPTTYLATSQKEYSESIKKIKSKKAVIKPFYGSGGFGIVIDEKKNVIKLKATFPVLVQEFVKSNYGIPGFSKNMEIADLRMVYMNHKLIYALSRIAKKGSLFTNFHQGATAVLVPEVKIPKIAKDTARKIVEKLSIFPEANYSLDFVFDNSGKPVLMEMNTTPGFDLLHIVGDERIKDKNFKEFISVLN